MIDPVLVYNVIYKDDKTCCTEESLIFYIVCLKVLTVS